MNVIESSFAGPEEARSKSETVINICNLIISFLLSILDSYTAVIDPASHTGQLHRDLAERMTCLGGFLRVPKVAEFGKGWAPKRRDLDPKR